MTDDRHKKKHIVKSIDSLIHSEFKSYEVDAIIQH